MTVLLGGSASPIGWSVQFVDAPSDVVLAGLLDWRRSPPLSQRLEVSAPRPFPAVLDALVPFEAPWTRELVLPCGRWTAYLNNFVNGGDPSASVQVIADRLRARWVMGMSTLRHGPGHQATQLWVAAPDGPTSLVHERTLCAHAEDGRWTWDDQGRPYPFEDVERYGARRKRDRFDRALLLRYLVALGIPADDDAAYGDGVIVQQRADRHVERPPRVESLAEARADIRWSS